MGCGRPTSRERCGWRGQWLRCSSGPPSSSSSGGSTNGSWVVYAKRPFADAAAVVGYLGRYTHRTAISNRRLIRYDGRCVSFTWKDYRDQGQRKVMTLAVEEFIRRFLVHVLPAGFKRIRHYGLLACRGRRERLALCRRLLTEATVHAVGGTPVGAPAGNDVIADAQAAGEAIPLWRQCPSCGKELRIRLWVWPKGCGPPSGWQQQGPFYQHAWQRKAA